MTNQFDGTGQGQQADPFGTAPDVSNYPKMDQLRGCLLLITPTRLETGLLSSFSKPGNPQYQDRITANVVVLDNLPVRLASGQPFEVNEFTAMYFSQSRLVAQLSPNVGTGRAILGRLDTYRPGEKAEAGNPWGIAPMTDADADLARRYLAGDRSMIPPLSTPAAPVQQAATGSPWAAQQPQATAQAPQQVQVQQQVAAGSPWAAQQPSQPAQPASPAANPFGQPGAPAPGAGNPFAR